MLRLPLLLALAAAVPVAAQTAPDTAAVPVGPVLVATPDSAAVPVTAPVANPGGDRAANPGGDRAANSAGGREANPDGEAGQALLTVGTHAAAVAGMFGLLLYRHYGYESPLLPALFVLSPLATGGVACVTGQAFGVPGSCRRALVGSYLGAAPAIGVTALAVAAGGDLWTPLVVVGTAGVILYLVGPPLLALEGYRGARLVPGLALARTPEGATSVAALRVEF